MTANRNGISTWMPMLALIVVMGVLAVTLLGAGGAKDTPQYTPVRSQDVKEAVEVVEEVTPKVVEKVVKDLIDVMHKTDEARNTGDAKLAAELHDKAVELSVWLIKNAPDIDIEHLDQYVLDNY